MIASTQPELLATIQSIRTRAMPTKSMLWSGPNNTLYRRYASYLPGLRYWHVYEQFCMDWNSFVVNGIRILMGRDVEVTFGRTE